MDTPPIGLDIEDLQQETKSGIRTAADLGFRCLEIPAGQGDVSPDALSSSGRRHLARLVDGFGLKIVAITAEFPELRLTDPVGVHQRVEKTIQVLDLARDLGVSAVVAATGALTHPDTGDPSPVAIEGLAHIAEHADARSIRFCIRASQDDEDRLSRILQAVACPSLKLCLDPAALVMAGANPMAVLQRFANQIELVHARDGTVGRSDSAGAETDFGRGDVDWMGMLVVLSGVEYQGPYIVRRHVARSPASDLDRGRAALLDYINRR